MKTLYKTAVTASGARAGSIKSEDGKIDMNLSVPKSMGVTAEKEPILSNFLGVLMQPVLVVHCSL